MGMLTRYVSPDFINLLKSYEFFKFGLCDILYEEKYTCNRFVLLKFTFILKKFYKRSFEKYIFVYFNFYLIYCES